MVLTAYMKLKGCPERIDAAIRHNNLAAAVGE